MPLKDPVAGPDSGKTEVAIATNDYALDGVDELKEWGKSFNAAGWTLSNLMD